MADLIGELPKPDVPKDPPRFRVVTPIKADLPKEFRTLGQSENLSPDGMDTIYRENAISLHEIVEGIKRPIYTKIKEPTESDKNSTPLPGEWICVSGYLHDLQKVVDKFGPDVGTIYRQWGAKAIGNRIDQGIVGDEGGKYRIKRIVPIWPERRDDECEMWLFGITKEDIEGIKANFLKPMEQKMELSQGEDGEMKKAETYFEASIGVISSQDKDPEIQAIFKETEETLKRGDHPDSPRLLAQVRRRMLLNRLIWEEEVDGRGLFHTPIAAEQRKRIREILEEDKDIKISLSEAKDQVNQKTILDMALGAHHGEREKRKVAEEEARIDHLTGLSNRRAFEERLNEEWELVIKRFGGSLTMLEIDIDHFKDINDKHGHDVGDEVLKRVANAIKESVREADFVARIGGEEFGVLMPGLNQVGEQEKKELIERVRKAVEESKDYPEGASPTVSIGAATYPNGKIKDPEALKKGADTALYKAKEEGRNKVVEFEDLNPQG